LRNRRQLSRLLLLSLGLILTAFVLTVVQLARFSRVRSNLPTGLKIAGVLVGGLDRQQAAQRLLETYSTPVELRYNGSVIHMDPAVVDFQLNLESMLAVADLERTEKFFWQEFWDYLWGRSNTPTEVPLSSSYSEKRLRDYLAELSVRYDQPAQAPLPVPGSVNFAPGQAGLTLDPDGSVRLIEAALKSLSRRDMDLPLNRTNPPRPAFSNLEVLLKQTLDSYSFDDLASIYLLDLQTAQEMHFARQKGEDIPVQPDIAFTASSIIKIPIMVSAFRRMPDNPDSETLKLLTDMIEKSGNESADWLMQRVLDPNLGPLVVSDDMKKLGLVNTFLAGEFTFGSPLLQRFETPANSRTDVDTDPDPYSQTTPADIGMLMEDIYQCAQSGGGALTAIFPGEITQAKCQSMLGYLINNRLPVLITAGLPEGTQVAHKHGWVTTDGVIRTIGDAGIVYSLGGNYVLVIFLNHPDQLVWEPASNLIALLSQAVYNYYNPPADASS
jgi:beta-lactamase class A